MYNPWILKWIFAGDPCQAYMHWEEWFLKHNPDMECCQTNVLVFIYKVPYWAKLIRKIIWFFPRLFGRISSP